MFAVGADVAPPSGYADGYACLDYNVTSPATAKDIKEGTAAFREKRQAIFKGK